MLLAGSKPPSALEMWGWTMREGDPAVFAPDRTHTYRHSGEGELRFVKEKKPP
ncbi:hypothetical protein [Streptomyces cremeus]|uniref:Uncharacterized protein n=1 Tax=Streptomyces cremeus TaxID=66881 RepID=A0ABV5P707_STRCM